MSDRMLPNLGLSNKWTVGSNGWAPGMDGDLQALDTLGMLTVISASTESPPSSPTQGDRYIIPAAATGAWASSIGDVAVWIDGGWAFYLPQQGWQAFVASVGSYFQFNGSVWAVRTQPYDIQAFRYVVPAAPEPIFSLMMPRPTGFPAALAGSIASLSTAPAAEQTFTLSQNGSAVATITFAASGTTGTIAAASVITLASGDILELDGPASGLDTTMRGLRVVLVGSRNL
jgi:hypothetical protein